ncbi:hypothetical protein DYE49_02690 [Treponema rectale]|uniref:Uncharacterized protein n=1 Tax=Treponema rectale TaxID=744512 RepID=A0A7M1XKU4_9SPIR|nr:hypothetical protein DYE49_02690 [Treponema rectale]
MLKEKKVTQSSIKESVDASRYLPPFFIFYNLLVLFGLLSVFLVLLLVVILPERGNGNAMLTAVIAIQLIGLVYFIPCYLLPEVYFLVRYKTYRRINISLMMVSTFFYACFYPLFYLFLAMFAH